MKIIFADKNLEYIETDKAVHTGLPVSIIQAARRKISFIRAAPDLSTLINWKSLGLRIINEIDKDYAIVLAAAWTLRLTIHQENGLMVANILTLSQLLKGVA